MSCEGLFPAVGFTTWGFEKRGDDDEERMNSRTPPSHSKKTMNESVRVKIGHVKNSTTAIDKSETIMSREEPTAIFNPSSILWLRKTIAGEIFKEPEEESTPPDLNNWPSGRGSAPENFGLNDLSSRRVDKHRDGNWRYPHLEKTSTFYVF